MSLMFCTTADYLLEGATGYESTDKDSVGRR